MVGTATIYRIETYGGKVMKQDKKMVRTFGENSGCRDLDEDKLDYEGFISPLVLLEVCRIYAQK